MSDKPASLFVLAPLDNYAALGFWKPFFGNLDPGEISFHETATALVAGLAVKSYSLVDHQFVRASVKTKKGELAVLLPRQHVIAIIEGKVFKKEDFGFLPGPA